MEFGSTCHIGLAAMRGSSRQWPHRPEVKRSKPPDLGFPNANHMCRVAVNDSDKSTLFSLRGSVYMKM